MSEESFQAAIDKTARLFKERAYKSVILLHHNDADGLSSGAILLETFEREKLSVRRYCLEKPYPEAVATILTKQYPSRTAIVFADFGSGMLSTLNAYNRNNLDMYVLDHHTIESTNHSTIQLLNCLEHSIPGSTDCSASSLCSLFAIALNVENGDLSGLGVTGAFGDKHDKNGALQSINKQVYEIAFREGVITNDPTPNIITGSSCIPVDELVDSVDALGSFGYFVDGPDVAISLLLDGPDEEDMKRAKQLRSEFNQKLETFLLGNYLHVSGDISWFRLDETFEGMGVKTVGLVCEALATRGLTDPSKYILGFQSLPLRIPNLCTLSQHQIKISMRVPTPLRNNIANGIAPSLATILPTATLELGGFVDACHVHAAATTIPAGSEQLLLQALNAAIKSHHI